MRINSMSKLLNNPELNAYIYTGVTYVHSTVKVGHTEGFFGFVSKRCFYAKIWDIMYSIFGT